MAKALLPMLKIFGEFHFGSGLKPKELKVKL